MNLLYFLLVIYLAQITLITILMFLQIKLEHQIETQKDMIKRQQKIMNSLYNERSIFNKKTGKDN